MYEQLPAIQQDFNKLKQAATSNVTAAAAAAPALRDEDIGHADIL
jgi:hypothetical protein